MLLLLMMLLVFVISLDVANHHLVRIEALPVDELLHGLLTHSPHVVSQ